MRPWLYLQPLPLAGFEAFWPFLRLEASFKLLDVESAASESVHSTAFEGFHRRLKGGW